MADILERQSELAAIEGVLAKADAGNGSLLLVEGPAGVGKSSLLRAAPGDRRALRATGIEFERDHAFGVVRQLLEPALGPRLLKPGPDPGDPDATFAIFHGLHWAVADLAEHQPLLVLVDDAHWADRLSLRFLLYLAHRLEDLPVALLIAARTGEPGADENLFLALREHRSTTVVRPAPLSPGAVATILERAVPNLHPELARACTETTRGNPFLVHALADDLRLRDRPPSPDEVLALAPRTVREATAARLARLPAPAAAVARAAAVLGDDATARTAAMLADVDHTDVPGALDALRAAHVLEPTERVRFLHPLIQAAVLDAVSPAERAAAHGRAAAILRGDGTSNRTVAAHLLRADATGDPHAVAILEAAARESLSEGAPESAARFLDRALREPPRPDKRADITVALGQAEARAGQMRGLERIRSALDELDPARRADVLGELGWTLIKQGDLPAALAAFDDALRLLGREPHRRAEAIARLEAARMTAFLGASAEVDLGDAERLAAQPVQALDAGDRAALPLMAMRLLWAGERSDLVVAMARSTWHDGGAIDSFGWDSPVVWQAATALAWADALDEAESVIEGVVTRAGDAISPVALALALHFRSWTRFWRGDVIRSLADGQAAVDAWSGEFAGYLPGAVYWVALGHLELDDAAAARHAVALTGARERWGRTATFAPYLVGCGAVALADGDAHGAAALFQEAGDLAVMNGMPNPALLPWRSWLALARTALGESDRACQAAYEEVELARRFGAPRPLGIALRVAGLVDGGREGLERLTESVTVLRRSPAALELARALIDLGAATRRRGSPATARDPLREGMALAQRMGAIALERRAHDELLAAGGRPRRRELTGLASLTPSELRVAELAAAGLTNREIARSLFVTVKAVRFHLGNVYRKLDADGREQLPDLVAATARPDASDAEPGARGAHPAS
jgi:DNA-binding CsgD family transcriptional regulator/tetratricopeptide (TPR) repeat protein